MTAREATNDELPAILTTLPWATHRKPPPELLLTPINEPPRLRWRPGEREAWLRSGARYCWPDRWPALHQEVVDHRDRYGGSGASLFVPDDVPIYLLSGPIGKVLPWFTGWVDRGYRYAGIPEAATAIVARYGLATLPLVRAGMDDRHPEWAGPIADPALVWYAIWELQSVVRAPVIWEWLLRHPEGSALGLVPIAVGPAGVRRMWAGEALRRLVAEGHRDTVLAVADRYGPEAADLVATILAGPERPTLQHTLLPGWLNPTKLPPVLLRDRQSRLPADAVRVLLAWFVSARRGWPQPDLDDIAQVCDPVSLSEFVNAILDRWLADKKATGAWVPVVVARFGDDSTVDRLTAVLPYSWVLDALAAIGTERALSALAIQVLTDRYGQAGRRARALLDNAARERGVTTDALIDQVMPDFGLPADRTITVDYGSRTFEVRFDHLLEPVVTGLDGWRSASLAKLRVTDGPAARRSQRRFRALSWNVAAAAAAQVDRLSDAMLSGRRWAGAAFRRDLLGNPISRSIADRLLWTLNGTTVFRVAEDGSAADLTDTELAIADDATIGVAHPIELGDALPLWRQVVLVDYRIHQPFEQLDRPVFRVAPGKSLIRRLARYRGRKIQDRPYDRSWRWGGPDNGLTALLPDGRQVLVIPDGRSGGPDCGTIRSVVLSDPSPLCGPFPHDPVVVSELFLKLETLVTP